MVKNCDNCAHDAPVKSEACKTCERIRPAWSGEPWSDPSNWKAKAVTNGDRIRAMSDEELGVFLAEWAEKPRAWKQDGEGECLAWLKDPYKENTYKAMYRCRLCGKAFYSGSEKDEQTARGYMNTIIAGLNQKYLSTPPLLYKHDCGEPYNGIGLADFIGWDAEEEG